MNNSINDQKDMLHIYQKFKDVCGFKSVGKLLGKGHFGEVREIIAKNNKIMAGKLVKRESDEKTVEEEYAIELRNQNIIRINKIYSKEIGGINYDLIIMEKATLKDLGKLNEFYHRFNLLKLIFNPFDELSGDCLLRFYSRQIINALEALDRNYYIHYDIKPENLLVGFNLVLKLSDFSLLRKAKDGNTKIPGGTPGFLTPEYYIDRNVSCEDARKQDYFALGSTLFYLKYGTPMLKYKKSDSSEINSFSVIDLLQKNINFIKSNKRTDKDFIEFLCSLIQYRPEDRPSFEEIYRNNWLNKDVEYINNIVNAFENDEQQLMMELQKKDFLIKIEKELNGKHDGHENEISKYNKNEKELKDNSFNDEFNNINEIKPKKPCRFHFKKKKKPKSNKI